MHTADSWYLTVVRTQGLLFIRPAKSWRPVVSVGVVDPHQTYEVALGSDGQNPNLQKPFVLRDVDHSSQLDIQVWHKPSSKNRKKRHLVGSAYVSLGEVIRRQQQPGSDLDLHLNCPPPQKRSPTIKANHQRRTILTIRVYPPSSALSTGITSSGSLEDEDERLSETSSESPSETLVTPTVDGHEDTWPQEAEQTACADGHQLRRRRRRIKGYSLDSEAEDGNSSSSDSHISQHANYPPTPEPYEYSHVGFDEVESPQCTASSLGTPTPLPRYAERAVEDVTLSFAEAVVDSFAPYRELRHAELEADFDKVLGRLLTEWYVVGASLLAIAGIDAAIFGLAPGSILPVDGIAQHIVAIGAVAAGLGIAIISWFLVLYSSANAVKFQRLARDVYGSYFFFCLTCRLPTLCMFLSALALTLFLLIVAWSAAPSAVLVLSFLAGVLVSLQYLVFGCHRAFNFVIWACRGAWRVLGAGRGSAAAADSSRPPRRPHAQPHEERPVEISELRVDEPRADERIPEKAHFPR
ncbi:hypothetical protein POSPLADRAFT_1072046 [Postia placenta MAD-698-R-SB12]|uniref:C2 domain-containing protein n=1 Tax=Postia placenta MAD-698-R-SB12 TaxID=670580 RepID=A0A1X6NE85_9APHY|nr:hypothetical protein POSPLADRAFT_1072046 [Postia placenta MAD-698-R-SB12]OSX66820.1 hypothetical protein POSPLADRAFT_1072046 [Postia placenta MAD-698-R-SB12]